MNPVHCFPVHFCVYYNCTQETEKTPEDNGFYSLPPHSFPILCFHISLFTVWRIEFPTIDAPFFCLFSENQELFSMKVYGNIYVYAPVSLCRRFFTQKMLIGGLFFCQI